MRLQHGQTLQALTCPVLLTQVNSDTCHSIGSAALQGWTYNQASLQAAAAGTLAGLCMHLAYMLKHG